MWFSDRLSSTSEYSHSSFDFVDDVTTWFYDIVPVDWWEDFGESWGLVVIQIILAAPFYAIGSLTIINFYPIESAGMLIAYAILATVVNVVFDLLVTRNLDEGLI